MPVKRRARACLNKDRPGRDIPPSEAGGRMILCSGDLPTLPLSLQEQRIKWHTQHIDRKIGHGHAPPNPPALTAIRTIKILTSNSAIVTMTCY